MPSVMTEMLSGNLNFALRKFVAIGVLSSHRNNFNLDTGCKTLGFTVKTILFSYQSEAYQLQYN